MILCNLCSNGNRFLLLGALESSLFLKVRGDDGSIFSDEYGLFFYLGILIIVFAAAYLCKCRAKNKKAKQSESHEDYYEQKKLRESREVDIDSRKLEDNKRRLEDSANKSSPTLKKSLSGIVSTAVTGFRSGLSSPKVGARLGKSDKQGDEKNLLKDDDGIDLASPAEEHFRSVKFEDSKKNEVDKSSSPNKPDSAASSSSASKMKLVSRIGQIMRFNKGKKQADGKDGKEKTDKLHNRVEAATFRDDTDKPSFKASFKPENEAEDEGADAKADSKNHNETSDEEENSSDGTKSPGDKVKIHIPSPITPVIPPTHGHDKSENNDPEGDKDTSSGSGRQRETASTQRTAQKAVGHQQSFRTTENGTSTGSGQKVRDLIGIGALSAQGTTRRRKLVKKGKRIGCVESDSTSEDASTDPESKGRSPRIKVKLPKAIGDNLVLGRGESTKDRSTSTKKHKTKGMIFPKPKPASKSTGPNKKGTSSMTFVSTASTKFGHKGSRTSQSPNIRPSSHSRSPNHARAGSPRSPGGASRGSPINRSSEGNRVNNYLRTSNYNNTRNSNYNRSSNVNKTRNNWTPRGSTNTPLGDRSGNGASGNSTKKKTKKQSAIRGSAAMADDDEGGDGLSGWRASGYDNTGKVFAESRFKEQQQSKFKVWNPTPSYDYTERDTIQPGHADTTAGAGATLASSEAFGAPASGMDASPGSAGSRAGSADSARSGVSESRKKSLWDKMRKNAKGLAIFKPIQHIVKKHEAAIQAAAPPPTVVATASPIADSNTPAKFTLNHGASALAQWQNPNSPGSLKNRAMSVDSNLQGKTFHNGVALISKLTQQSNAGPGLVPEEDDDMPPDLDLKDSDNALDGIDLKVDEKRPRGERPSEKRPSREDTSGERPSGQGKKSSRDRNSQEGNGSVDQNRILAQTSETAKPQRKSKKNGRESGHGSGQGESDKVSPSTRESRLGSRRAASHRGSRPTSARESNRGSRPPSTRDSNRGSRPGSAGISKGKDQEKMGPPAQLPVAKQLSAMVGKSPSSSKSPPKSAGKPPGSPVTMANLPGSAGSARRAAKAASASPAGPKKKISPYSETRALTLLKLHTKQRDEAYAEKTKGFSHKPSTAVFNSVHKKKALESESKYPRGRTSPGHSPAAGTTPRGVNRNIPRATGKHHSPSGLRATAASKATTSPATPKSPASKSPSVEAKSPAHSSSPKANDPGAKQAGFNAPSPQPKHANKHRVVPTIAAKKHNYYPRIPSVYPDSYPGSGYVEVPRPHNPPSSARAQYLIASPDQSGFDSPHLGGKAGFGGKSHPSIWRSMFNPNKKSPKHGQGNSDPGHQSEHAKTYHSPHQAKSKGNGKYQSGQARDYYDRVSGNARSNLAALRQYSPAQRRKQPKHPMQIGKSEKKRGDGDIELSGSDDEDGPPRARASAAENALPDRGGGDRVSSIMVFHPVTDGSTEEKGIPSLSVQIKTTSSPEQGMQCMARRSDSEEGRHTNTKPPAGGVNHFRSTTQKTPRSGSAGKHWSTAKEKFNNKSLSPPKFVSHRDPTPINRTPSREPSRKPSSGEDSSVRVSSTPHPAQRVPDYVVPSYVAPHRALFQEAPAHLHLATGRVPSRGLSKTRVQLAAPVHQAPSPGQMAFEPPSREAPATPIMHCENQHTPRRDQQQHFTTRGNLQQYSYSPGVRNQQQSLSPGGRSEQRDRTVRIFNHDGAYKNHAVIPNPVLMHCERSVAYEQYTYNRRAKESMIRLYYGGRHPTSEGGRNEMRIREASLDAGWGGTQGKRHPETERRHRKEEEDQKHTKRVSLSARGAGSQSARQSRSRNATPRQNGAPRDRTVSETDNDMLSKFRADFSSKSNVEVLGKSQLEVRPGIYSGGTNGLAGQSGTSIDSFDGHLANISHVLSDNLSHLMSPDSVAPDLPGQRLVCQDRVPIMLNEHGSRNEPIMLNEHGNAKAGKGKARRNSSPRKIAVVREASKAEASALENPTAFGSTAERKATSTFLHSNNTNMSIANAHGDLALHSNVALHGVVAGASGVIRGSGNNQKRKKPLRKSPTPSKLSKDGEVVDLRGVISGKTRKKS